MKTHEDPKNSHCFGAGKNIACLVVFTALKVENLIVFYASE